MSSEDAENESVSIQIPKWLMPAFISILATAALSIIAWSWNAESRIREGELALVKVELLDDKISKEEQEVALIKQELRFIREDLKEALELLRGTSANGN